MTMAVQPGDLTERQFQVLRFLFRFWRRRGKPPTIAEICGHFGFASTRSAFDHLRALERKGYIDRVLGSRGIEIREKVWELFGLPILGRVPAGEPRLADAEFLGVMTPDDFYPQEEGLVVVKVQGESMVGAGILPGDYVVVREQPTADPGDIVLAAAREEAGEGEVEVTVKRLARRDGELYLEPANERYEPIPLDGGRILGVVIKVHRDL